MQLSSKAFCFVSGRKQYDMQQRGATLIPDFGQHCGPFHSLTGGSTVELPVSASSGAHDLVG